VRPPSLACDNWQWRDCTPFVLSSQYVLLRIMSTGPVMSTGPANTRRMGGDPIPVAVVIRLQPIQICFSDTSAIRRNKSVKQALHRSTCVEGHSPVDRVDNYRHLAERCVELASTVESAQDRTILLEMALVWRRLSEYAAKHPAKVPADSE
jgi:hypothetical protein